MTKFDIAAQRRDYRDLPLDEEDVASSPFEQFRIWFDQASEAEVRDATAMTVATADAKGRPSARIVLLKGFDEDGFVFYTNYGSRKAREIEENPWGALVFWWTELDRQVRIQGRIERTTYEESMMYFATRPRGSQLGAIASPQSRVIPNRQALVDAVAHADECYREQDVQCPENWGGFRVVPHHLEFWQGRPSRLHDRICYRLDDEHNWIIERLAP